MILQQQKEVEMEAAKGEGLAAEWNKSLESLKKGGTK